VTSVWEGSRRLLNQYPGLTFIYDTKDDQSPHFVAALSKRPELCKASLVQFYTWGPADGEQFASQIEAAGAAADWKENVNLVPVVQIQPLAERLFAEPHRAPSDPTRDYDDLFARVRTWVDSMMDKGFKVKGIQVLLGGIGESYDRSSGGAFDLAGQPVTDPQILEDYRDDHLLIDLHAYVRAAYPNLPIFSIVRAYDVAQDSRRYKWGPVDGKPEGWGKHSDLFEQHATPGKTRNRYDFDFIVADLFPRALEYEAHLASGIALDEKSGNPWADLTRSVADIPRQT